MSHSPSIGHSWSTRLILPLLLAIASSPVQADEKPKPAVEFNRDIRPILQETCFQCHGPDSAARKANLRLDKRDAAIEAEAIAPGKPDDSALLDRIYSDDPEEVMPPPSTKKKLTAEQKELLKNWIAQGAEYQPHWSFLPPKRPELPAVKDASWVRNPIDRFILSKLEEKGLKPAPEADRRTLARRLSLDLNGLPPVPADVEVFVHDQSPNWYEKYVDKLLASPRWGEHRSRYWLDVARYADTHGIHFDNYREMWSYREWVIKAFNANMPFDQFTIEQMAGDLLPNRTLEQQIASGFNRCNITTNEGGAIDEEYLVLYARDRTETVSQVFLGLTTGCAVCHDHKYDPISQKEFYELSAFFNNNQQAAMDGNIPNTPPAVVVPTATDRPRWEALVAELSTTKTKADERRKVAKDEFDKWFATSTPETFDAQISTEGQKLRARLNDRDAAMPTGPTTAPILELSESGDFEKDQAFSYGAWVKFSKGDTSGSLIARMDDQHEHRGWDLWVEGNRVGTHIIHKWPDDALKVMSANPVTANEWHHVMVTYDGSAKPSGVKIYVDGKMQTPRVDKDALKGTIRAGPAQGRPEAHLGQDPRHPNPRPPHLRPRPARRRGGKDGRALAGRLSRKQAGRQASEGRP